MANLGLLQEHFLTNLPNLLEHEEIDTLLEEAWELRTTSTSVEFSQIVDKIDMLSDNVNYSIGKAACQILRTQHYTETQEMKKALEDLHEVKVFIETTSATIWKFRLYLCLSSLYFELNQPEQSLNYALTQLRLAQNLKNDKYAAIATLNIGRLHTKLHNSDNALSYFADAEVLFNNIDDTWGVIITLLNKCTFYVDSGNLEACEPIAKKAMEISLAINDIRGICLSDIKLGYCAIHKNNYSLAKTHFESSLSAADKLDLEETMVACLLELALIPDLIKVDKKHSYLDKALAITTKLGAKDWISKCYKTFAQFYKENGDFESAFTAIEQHMILEQEASKLELNNVLLVFETEKAQRKAEMHRLKSVELQATVDELEVLNKKVKEFSIRDALTGLYNRRHLEEQIHPLFEQAVRYKKLFSICLLDIDNFKKINDNFSHQTGDEVLKAFSNILSNSIRSADIAARYGGEEFIILMPETSLGNAHQLAERLRQNIEDFDWSTIALQLKVTSSFGLSSKDTVKPEEQHPEKLISLADTELYLAKEQGRNRVCSSCPPPQT